MLSFEEPLSAFNEVKDKYLIILATSSSAPAVLVTSTYTTKLLGTNYDWVYVFWIGVSFILALIFVFLILMGLSWFIYYKFKFNPIKIVEINYKMIIRLLPDDDSEEQGPRIVTDTFQILANDETTARYKFTLKIADSIKNKFEGKNKKHSRFSLIIKTPSTIKLNPWKRKSRWDQKVGKSENGQLFCLDQEYEGSSNRLKFDLKINSESFDETTSLEIYFEYGSKLERDEDGDYSIPNDYIPSKERIHYEKIHFIGVNVIDS